MCRVVWYYVHRYTVAGTTGRIGGEMNTMEIVRGPVLKTTGIGGKTRYMTTAEINGDPVSVDGDNATDEQLLERYALIRRMREASS